MNANLTVGQRFGRLEVIARGDKVGKSRKWICKCSCGNVIQAYSSNLFRGGTKSCGCLKRENGVKHLIKHGMSKSDEYKIWAGIIKRCENPNSTMYYLYGARGITVCDQWKASFKQFFSDMGKRPSKKHSVDRIDGTKGYFPENCRWATPNEQSENTSRAIIIKHDGFSGTVRSFCTLKNIDYFRFYHWLVRKQKTIEEALALVQLPVRNRH